MLKNIGSSRTFTNTNHIHFYCHQVNTYYPNTGDVGQKDSTEQTKTSQRNLQESTKTMYVSTAIVAIFF